MRGARLGPRRVGGGVGLRGMRAHRADRVAEQCGIVVVAIVGHASSVGAGVRHGRKPSRRIPIGYHAASRRIRRRRKVKAIHASPGQQRRRRRRPRHPHPRRGPARRRPRRDRSSRPTATAPAPAIRSRSTRPSAPCSSDDARPGASHGTPTDCVHVALTGMLEDEPDIVVSGINNTANLGDDVIYSGTVAAAMEGRFLGLPAVAMSLATADHNGRALRNRRARRGRDHRAPGDRSAAGRHHPQRQRARPAVGRDARFRGHAPGQPPSRRTLHPAAGSARPPRAGGSARPAPSRTPAPAPISTPCAPATSRSRRSTST